MHIYDMIVILVFTSSESLFISTIMYSKPNIGDSSVSMVDIYVYICRGYDEL
jgi:hypothetical protein